MFWIVGLVGELVYWIIVGFVTWFLTWIFTSFDLDICLVVYFYFNF